MTFSFIHLVGIAKNYDVRLPLCDSEVQDMFCALRDAANGRAIYEFDEAVLKKAYSWVRSIESQIGHVRYGILLKIIDDLTISAALR